MPAQFYLFAELLNRTQSRALAEYCYPRLMQYYAFFTGQAGGLLRYIDKRAKTPLIPEELWEEAKHATFSAYDGSLSLTYVKRCVEPVSYTHLDVYKRQKLFSYPLHVILLYQR